MAEAASSEPARSDVPDVLAPGLRCVFCGINPGRVSAAANAHFANPRNDFWRLLHAAGFTPRLYDPSEQFDLLALGYGVTNAAYRTTPGSGDLRRGDFDGDRLGEVARELRPRAIAFVGKEAYRGSFGERAELGPQIRSLGSTALYVLPSTSPANAAVPWDERLRWFSALHGWLEPEPRQAVRALVVDAQERVLLVRFENAASRESWWATPGGGVEEGESDESALRRELREECGLELGDAGPVVWRREVVFPWNRRLLRQSERFHMVRVAHHDPVATIDLRPEGIAGHRWWTLDELASTAERLAPRALATGLRGLLRDGPPATPLDIGIQDVGN
ncbi:MAG TPA: NUDIX domain-containing protein [Gaiellaceae bacterium]|nr:NUDIX domain-containing protein [Gaiellaceae bacterium]